MFKISVNSHLCLIAVYAIFFHACPSPGSLLLLGFFILGTSGLKLERSRRTRLAEISNLENAYASRYYLSSPVADYLVQHSPIPSNTCCKTHSYAGPMN